MARRGGRSKWYNEEFKMAAVKLALSTDRPVNEIAQDLGVSETAVRNWVKLYGKAAAGDENCFTPEEHRELVKLRRDLKRVTEERDILKKALGILSTELP